MPTSVCCAWPLARCRCADVCDCDARVSPDQLLIGNNGLSRTEAEVQMGMWALWSAPMILSVEVRNGSLPAEMKAILTNKEVSKQTTT